MREADAAMDGGMPRRIVAWRDVGGSGNRHPRDEQVIVELAAERRTADRRQHERVVREVHSEEMPPVRARAPPPAPLSAPLS